MFEEGHQVTIIEIMSDVKERGPKKVMPSYGVWEHTPQFHLSRRDFPWALNGHVHNTQRTHALLHSIPPLWPGTYSGIRQANWPCVK